MGRGSYYIYRLLTTLRNLSLSSPASRQQQTASTIKKPLNSSPPRSPLIKIKKRTKKLGETGKADVCFTAFLTSLLMHPNFAQRAVSIDRYVPKPFRAKKPPLSNFAEKKTDGWMDVKYIRRARVGRRYRIVPPD